MQQSYCIVYLLSIYCCLCYTNYGIMKSIFGKQRFTRLMTILLVIIFTALVEGICMLNKSFTLMIIVYFLYYFLMTRLYEEDIRKGLIVGSFILAILVLVSTGVQGFYREFTKSFVMHNVYYVDRGLVTIVMYLIMRILEFRKQKGQFQGFLIIVPIVLMIEPVLSYLIEVYMLQITIASEHMKFVCSIMIMLSNASLFCLSDVIALKCKKMIELERTKNMGEYYRKQIQLMKESNECTRSIRHDIKNHMLVLRTLAETGDNKAIIQYIDHTTEHMISSDEISRTGNPTIDAVINNKYMTAKQNGIRMEATLCIPEILYIDPFDLGGLIGNLLDNSIEAVSLVAEKKEIKVDIKEICNLIFISVSNTYSGNLIKEKGEYQSTKLDGKNHGYGLKNVKQILDKYQGTLEIDASEGKFRVDAVMYQNVT